MTTHGLCDHQQGMLRERGAQLKGTMQLSLQPAQEGSGGASMVVRESEALSGGRLQSCFDVLAGAAGYGPGHRTRPAVVHITAHIISQHIIEGAGGMVKKVWATKT